MKEIAKSALLAIMFHKKVLLLLLPYREEMYHLLKKMKLRKNVTLATAFQERIVSAIKSDRLRSR